VLNARLNAIVIANAESIAPASKLRTVCTSALAR
jgi:hypothetical protein